MPKKLVYLIIFLFIILFTLQTIRACGSADKYYKQGLTFENQKKYQDAYYNYGKVSKFSKIYPLAIYKQAKCAKTIKDNKTAIKKYEKYTSIIKDDIMAPVGLWELGNLYYEKGDIKNAEKIFKKMEEKYPDNNYTYASYFRLGEILYNNDQEKAQSYFSKYLEYAPLGRFSKKGIQYIENANKNLTDEVKIIISNSLNQNGDYDKAISYLSSVPEEKKWMLEYQIYKNKQDEKTALATIEKGLSFKNTNAKEEDLKDAINYYLSKNKSNDDIKNLFNITNTQGNKAHIYIAVIYAQSLDNAYTLFSDILKSNSKYSDIVLSEMIYLDYKNQNYKTAIELGNIFYNKYKDTNTAPKAIYYLAKSFHKEGKKKQAESLYKKIISEYSRSYYAFRAYQMLKNKGSFDILTKKELPKEPKIIYQFSSNKGSDYLLNKLVQLGDISALDDLKIQDEFLKSFIAYKTKRHTYSILLARDEAYKNVNNLNKNQTMLLYPVYYEEDINRYSKIFNISPYLMIALIRKESHFDTGAKSGAGAIGLTQVLPETANYIEKGTLKGDIKNPSYNIYLGTKYYAHLKDIFKGNDLLSVMSYNAGPGNVKSWAKNIDDYDIFVENIPFDETKSYVKKVFEGFWNYVNLYK